MKQLWMLKCTTLSGALLQAPLSLARVLLCIIYSCCKMTSYICFDYVTIILGMEANKNEILSSLKDELKPGVVKL